MIITFGVEINFLDKKIIIVSIALVMFIEFLLGRNSLERK